MDRVEQFILALDQGTTSSRGIIFNRSGKIIAEAQRDLEPVFPRPGWVEQDPVEIWTTQASVATEAITKAGINAGQIAGIGITNQRETVIVWDRQTGKPLYNAIVWQDRRTASQCDQLISQGLEEMITGKTGLIIDSYFSASKIKWILDNVEGAGEKAKKGEICFGTVDSWLIWKLSGGTEHLTDITNASRTMLFNIHEQRWDDELLELFEIPAAILPEVKSNSEIFCETSGNIFAGRIPVAGVAGDQHAALFGQQCREKGMVKATYGTGCFLVMNTGGEAVYSKNRLLTTIAWKLDDKVTFALEGTVFIAGAALQWLRDGINMIENFKESEVLAEKLKDNEGVYFVPALTGLGAPHWDQDARGAFFGITRGTTPAHFSRAALESIAYQLHDVLRAMERDCGGKAKQLKVDGGATMNNLLMQFQADILDCTIRKPKITESTALGAAFFAGLNVGYWNNVEELKELWKEEKVFEPKMDAGEVEKNLHYWKKAVERAKHWMEP